MEGGNVFRLAAPDWAAWDVARGSADPFVLWPVCGKPLLGWWLDEAVRRGVERVEIFSPDRPHRVRSWLDEGNLWSREIEVFSHPPGEALTGTIHDGGSLPGQPIQESRVESSRALLDRWVNLHRQALADRDSQAVHLDREVRPGVWIGPGAKVDPSARLEAPCWVGAYGRVGPGCVVGPDAFVDAGAFLDEDVEVTESIVCADTYTGRHTSLKGVVVEGGLLIDRAGGHAVSVEDRFVLSSLHPSGKPGFGTRAFGLALWLLLAPLAAVAGGQWRDPKRVGDRRRGWLELHERSKGPLLIRRASWFRAVAAGHLRILGPLPRSEEDWARVPADARAVLEDAFAGVFSLADLHGCHSAAEDDEWMHAVYQLASPGGEGSRQTFWSILRIAFTNPGKT